jgi:5'-nucleotidase
MNPGGIRTDLDFENSNRGEAPGDITYEEAFSVQPFNNYLVSMNLTGAQIYDVLTQQVTETNADAHKVLQVSERFTYQLGDAGPVPGSVKLDAQAIQDDDSEKYRIVTNNFLSDGGDGFPAFEDGTNKYFGGLDIDAFADYLSASSPYTPGPLDRIIDATP